MTFKFNFGYFHNTIVISTLFQSCVSELLPVYCLGTRRDLQRYYSGQVSDFFYYIIFLCYMSFIYQLVLVKDTIDMKSLRQKAGQTRSQILSPWLEDKVDSGTGLSYRTARLPGDIVDSGKGVLYLPARCSLAGRYDNPMPLSTISSSQGLRLWLHDLSMPIVVSRLRRLLWTLLAN